MSKRLHITGLRADELGDLVQNIGEPKYRAKQIFKNLHARRLRAFDEMTDLPKAFREKLNESATATT
jgi:23S rRNA (adenine2503-C2)-methyltransferase